MSAVPSGGSDATGVGKDRIDELPVQAGPGNGQLQRALSRQGV